MDIPKQNAAPLFIAVVPLTAATLVFCCYALASKALVARVPYEQAFLN